MSEVVRLEKQGPVTHIVLNSPPANAMSPLLMEELDKIVSGVETDTESRSVVLRSDVNKIFMAGAGLKHLLSLDEMEIRQYIKTAQDCMNRIERLPKPTIAVLSGHVLSGGCELALSCDFRYMVDSKALIGLPEVTLGSLPGAGGTQRLPRLVGRSKAMELLIRGSILTGPEALEIGLVDRIFPAEDLLPQCINLAEELASGATQAIAKIKACLRVPSEETLSAALAQELDGTSYLFVRTQDCKEGIKAFNEKRRPNYSGI